MGKVKVTSLLIEAETALGFRAQTEVKRWKGMHLSEVKKEPYS